MSKHLTEDVIKAVFDSFDVDGNGVLSVKELRTALNRLCIDPTETELQKIFEEGLNENTDVMTLEEFGAFVEQFFKDIDYREKCQECLGEFDEEKQGKLTCETVKRILTQMGSDPIDPEEADDLIQQLDTNEDGYVSIEELAALMYDTEDLY